MLLVLVLWQNYSCFRDNVGVREAIPSLLVLQLAEREWMAPSLVTLHARREGRIVSAMDFGGHII